MWADPDADYDKIGKEQARPRGQDRRHRRVEPRAQRRDRHGRLRCPPDDADVTTLSGGERRRVALCRLLLSPPRPAAARRADQPPRRRVGRLAGALPARLRGHRRGHHPRPLLPRQRRPVDPRARPRQGASRSRATTPAGSSRSRNASHARRSGNEPASAPSPASSNGCAWRPRPARPRARPASPPTRSCSTSRSRPRRTASTLEITIPAGHRLGDQVIEVEGLSKGFGDRLLIEDLSFSLPPRRHRRHHRPERRRQDRRCSGCSPARRSPTPASIKIGDTVDLSYVDQDRDDLDPDTTVYEEITGGADELEVGGREIHGRAYVVELQLQGHRPAEAGRRPLRRRAQPGAPRQAAQVGRQRAAARRADQRPRRRHAAGARGRARDRSPAAPW